MSQLTGHNATPPAPARIYLPRFTVRALLMVQLLIVLQCWTLMAEGPWERNARSLVLIASASLAACFPRLRERRESLRIAAAVGAILGSSQMLISYARYVFTEWEEFVFNVAVLRDPPLDVYLLCVLVLTSAAALTGALVGCAACAVVRPIVHRWTPSGSC